jgi:hypothetical protein
MIITIASSLGVWILRLEGLCLGPILRRRAGVERGLRGTEYNYDILNAVYCLTLYRYDPLSDWRI